MPKRLEIEGLSADSLRFLYEVELLTETDIANRLGTSQRVINRRRREWGIPTITKAERARRSLPPLTTQQHELLIGSLLGDGWCSASSEASASFSENHSLKQEVYLKWKGSLLGDYLSSYYPTTKTVEGRVYKGVGLRSKSCPQIRPYYDLFYPAPDRKRVFPSNLHDLMTPFALSVWFMDDGSCRGFHPSITFGLDDLSLKRATRALRKLGLKPTLHEDDRDGSCSIHFPGQSDQFFALVREHIPECMTHKLPKESVRRDADRNAKKLTAEVARELYEGGMTVREIASLYGVGTSTVHRRVHKGGPKQMGRPRRKFSVRAAEVALGNIDPSAWKQLGPLERINQVSEVYKILRRIPFPAPEVHSVEEAKEEFERLAGKEVFLDGEGAIRPQTHIGLKICHGHFPNRFKASYKGQPSAYERWHKEKDLKAAIEYQLRVGDPVIPRRVLRAVAMMSRTPTVFRPGVARFVYQTYGQAGECRELPVWDPCAGFGGRLLGALSAGRRYIATDVEPETVEGNLRLAKSLGRLDDVRVVRCPAEEFDPGESLGLVFTSPPYFDREQYSTREEQSWKGHTTAESWVEAFLKPVFQTAWRRLSDMGHLVINIADLKQESEVVPLVSLTVSCATGVGFRHVETLKMPLSNLNRKDVSEPVLVFLKA